jgi:hypothetical protein
VAREVGAIDAFEGRVGALGSTTLGFSAGVFVRCVRFSTYGAGWDGLGATGGRVAKSLAVFALRGGGDGEVFLDSAGCVVEVDVRNS